MNLRLIFSFLALVQVTLYGIEVKVEKKGDTTMPLAIGMVKPISKTLNELVDTIERDISASRQFSCKRLLLSEDNIRKELKSLKRSGVSLAVIFSDSDNSLSWRLYNTLTGKVVSSQTNQIGTLSLRTLAHNVADQVWPVLTSEKGPFSSVIVACKQLLNKNHTKKISHIYAFSPTEGVGNARCIVGGSRVNFAPRWHPFRKQLFYSQHTPFNVSLMTKMPGSSARTLMSFDGQNMTPAVSNKGKVVISLSNGADAHLYEYNFDKETKKGRFIQLTKGHGQYISPSFRGENELVFCYSNIHGRPRIGMLDLSSKKLKWITPEHGLSPCVSPNGKKVAYTTRVDRVLQVFCYDFKTGKHTQVTSNKGHKDEVSWSPCGNYLLFSVEIGMKSQIACFHIPTKSMRYLSPEDEHWSFPSWSSLYQGEIPFL